MIVEAYVPGLLVDVGAFIIIASQPDIVDPGLHTYSFVEIEACGRTDGCSRAVEFQVIVNIPEIPAGTGKAAYLEAPLSMQGIYRL